jgi:hypothetical protein
MSNGFNEMRISGLSTTKAYTTPHAIQMHPAGGQVLLKRVVIDEGSIAWLAEKAAAIIQMSLDGAGGIKLVVPCFKQNLHLLRWHERRLR